MLVSVLMMTQLPHQHSQRLCVHVAPTTVVALCVCVCVCEVCVCRAQLVTVVLHGGWEHFSDGSVAFHHVPLHPPSLSTIPSRFCSLLPRVLELSGWKWT
jgi:hypothetical protein